MTITIALVYTSGRRLRRACMTSSRWRAGRALIEAAVHAARHQIYAERNRRTKVRLSRQRGPKIAQIDLARRLAEAIWHMLTTDKPFAPPIQGPPLRRR